MKATALFAALFFSASQPVFAQHVHHHTTSPAANKISFADGVIKKVDKPTGKLTIAHGPIESIAMPAMTMSFAVAEAKMLDAAKVGDKVRFAVESRKDVLTITKLEAAR